MTKLMDIQEIQIPYTTRPRMTKLSGPAFNASPDPEYIKQKRQELEFLGCELTGITHEARVNRLVERACDLLGRPKTSDITELALGFEEDTVILYQGRIAALCFCFPSGWSPTQRLGMTLAEVHSAVADSDHLVQASQRLAATMQDPVLGGFQRWVWTVTANPRLSNHPVYSTQQPDSTDPLKGLYFRTEFQTTVPYPTGDAAVFFVRTSVQPLSEVWSTLGPRITASVASMTPAVRTYKHLDDILPKLQQALDNNTQPVLV